MKKVFILFIVCIAVFTGTDTVNADMSVHTGFPDVVQGSWYESSVTVLSDMGAVNGYTDGTFRPDDDICVDEFIKILVSVMGYEIEWTDGYWAQGYIDSAYRHGLIFEGEITDFRRQAGRGEICRMVMRAEGSAYIKEYDDYQGNIDDFEILYSRYREYILAAYAKGIVNGIDGRFDQCGTASRKEACVIIHRLIDKEKRICGTGRGIISESMPAGSLYAKLAGAGFMTDEDTAADSMLTREAAADIIYRTILINDQLSRSILPVSEIVVRPVVFTAAGNDLSDTFYSICSRTRTIDQNFQAMQIFDIYRTYRDGTKKKILCLDLFRDKDVLSSVPKDLEGMKILSEADVSRPFDHERFAGIFSDSDLIDESCREAFFMLYDLGIMDFHEFSEYSADIFCVPKALMNEDEADIIIERLKDPAARRILDEREFGLGDSWGTEFYGSSTYTFRLSEMQMIRLYDIFSQHCPVTKKISPGKNGMIMLFYCSGRPYFDDFIYISDKCPQGSYNDAETTDYNDFITYDVYKYSYFVPRMYKDRFVSDVMRFLLDEGCDTFLSNYGGFEFSASSTVREGKTYIDFKYAFRGGE